MGTGAAATPWIGHHCADGRYFTGTVNQSDPSCRWDQGLLGLSAQSLPGGLQLHIAPQHSPANLRSTMQVLF